MRALILGEAPSRTGDRYWRFPLSGAVGQRLCTWAGLEPDPDGTRYGRYYWPLREAFDLENLIERYPGAKGRGAAFPPAVARGIVTAGVRERRWEGRTVVLLGRRLMDAFGLAGHPFHKWTRAAVGGHSTRGADVVGIPHPSGLTRAYNDPEAREAASETLREALRRAAPNDA